MIFEVNGVKFSYRGAPAVNSVSFELESRDVVSILGPNGVGKTTLLKCINRILKPSQGDVLIDGSNTMDMSRKDAAKHIGYVPQRGEISKMTVFDAVLLGRKPHIEWDAKESDLRLTGRVISLLGLGEISMKYIGEISGGEYQMVQIARAMAQKAKVILMDEPTSNLDLCNQHKILRLVTDVVHSNDMVAVMVIHDINLAIRYSNKFIMMKGGEIFAAGCRDILTPDNIAHAYGIDVFVDEVHGILTVTPKDER